MLERMQKVRDRYEEVTRLLSDPLVVSNQDRFRELSKEHSDLTPLMRAYERYRKTHNELTGLTEILEHSSDVEMKQLSYAEFEGVKQELERQEEELKLLLIPKDLNGTKNVIVEVRAGTGGKEAALFAAATSGWRGRRAAVIALVGFGSLLVTYYAVNLWIVGLHSYAK